ncbi:MAG TPA: hypothetical protein VGS20_06030 [Candidatus Acidoferrales bacterium]|nr:hypothetical protein [Candidatus Acidoferrales bacterium]
MGSWAEKTIKRLQRQEGAQELALEQNRLLRAQQPRVWEELRSWLALSCQELNEKAGARILVFEVTPVGEATPRVRHDEEAHRVRYECGAGRAELVFEADLGTCSVSLRDEHHRHFSTEEIGCKVLNLLMDSPF